MLDWYPQCYRCGALMEPSDSREFDRSELGWFCVVCNEFYYDEEVDNLPFDILDEDQIDARED